MISVLREAVDDILRYCIQMIPCMAVAGIAFFLLRPLRMRRLNRLGWLSPWPRELALFVFILFLAGLAGLTLFPSNLWSYVMQPNRYPEDVTFWSFYPTYPQIMERIDQLPQELPRIMTPFPYGLEWHFASYWFAFLFFGNICMFIPVGFFSALLWRKAHWWKSLCVGFFLSFFIEFVQFFINRGTDLDDLILNTLGALVGYWIYWLLRVLCPKQVSRFHCQSREGEIYHG